VPGYLRADRNELVAFDPEELPVSDFDTRAPKVG